MEALAMVVAGGQPPPGRGFAAMSEETRRRIASAGGLKAQSLGRSHRFTPEEAQAAGRRGAAVVLASRGLEHFREMGRRGGIARAAKRAAACAEQRKRS